MQETAKQRQASELIRWKKTQIHVSLSSFLCFLWVFCVLSKQLQTSYRNIRNSMLYRSVFKSQARYCLVDWNYISLSLIIFCFSQLCFSTLNAIYIYIDIMFCFKIFVQLKVHFSMILWNLSNDRQWRVYFYIGCKFS